MRRVVRAWAVRAGLVVGVIGAVLLVGGLVWALGPGTGWVLRHWDKVSGLSGKDQAAAADAVRGRIVAIATGLLAIVAVFYTARNAQTARRSAQLVEQGQVTDRYTKAIEQLGDDKLDIRIGGIYALERIARDSARDHPTVIEVLAAFIREHSTDDDANRPATSDAPHSDRGAVGRLRPDLQAALTVIGRRDTNHDDLNIDPNDDVLDYYDETSSINRIDLSYARLRRATLRRANLLFALLSGADLTGADMTEIHLSAAYLPDANLTGARLFNANLSGANLTGANLTGANLSYADLPGATLPGANLTGAKLTRADLTDASLRAADLTDANLTWANLTRTSFTDAELTDADLTDADLSGAVNLQLPPTPDQQPSQ